MYSEREINYHRFLVTQKILQAYKTKIQEQKKDNNLDQIHNFHEVLKEHDVEIMALTNLHIYLEKNASIKTDQDVDTKIYNNYKDMELLYNSSFQDLLNAIVFRLNPDEDEFRL